MDLFLIPYFNVLTLLFSEVILLFSDVNMEIKAYMYETVEFWMVLAQWSLFSKKCDMHVLRLCLCA